MDAQMQVAHFVAKHELAADPITRLLDLSAEVGELCKEALKGSLYGRRVLEPGDAWSEEMGDVFFSLLALANCTGVDLDLALSACLDKYAGRLAKKGDAGSGR